MPLKLLAIPPVEYDALAGLLEDNNLLASDLEGDAKRFFAFEDSHGWRIGVGGIEIAGTAGLLRSFLTMNAHRGQGLGGAMLDVLVEHVRGLGVVDLYLFTEDAAGFFAKYGFSVFDRAGAPEGIRQTRQFAIHCNQATFMHRALKPAP